MVFSSLTFLLFFLPLCLGAYYMVPQRFRQARNLVLLLFSLVFYAWGEPVYILLMVFSTLVDYGHGRLIGHFRSRPRLARLLLISSVTVNLGLLGVFKYAGFIAAALSSLAGLPLAPLELALPIGISFYTFQTMSYTIDVYRDKVPVQKSFLAFATYVSLFPQLIAGPIVRYSTVAGQLEERHETVPQVAAGLQRLIIGLGKKVLLANSIGQLWQTVRDTPVSDLSVLGAWLGILAFAFQIYFDFSGYSDMAIGLGRLFGFSFEENFNQPYRADSVSDFWRRWHISLGTWFRDYLFIPLGGSRVKSTWRLLFNMFVVWSLTGLWHGAYWKYLFWGICFFVFLAFERLTGLSKKLDKQPLGVLYAMIAVTTITVLIRSDDMAYASGFIGSMYGINANGFWDPLAAMYVREYGVFVALALITGLPVGRFVKEKLHVPERAYEVLSAVGLVAVFVISLSYIIMGGYNPFIYFNF